MAPRYLWQLQLFSGIDGVQSQSDVMVIHDAVVDVFLHGFVTLVEYQHRERVVARERRYSTLIEGVKDDLRCHNEHVDGLDELREADRWAVLARQSLTVARRTEVLAELLDLLLDQDNGWNEEDRLWTTTINMWLVIEEFLRDSEKRCDIRELSIAV